MIGIFSSRARFFNPRLISAKQKKAKLQDSETEIEERYKAPEVHDAELILAKNRNGETRTIRIEYNSKYTLFADKNEEREIKMAAQTHTALIGDVQTISLMTEHCQISKPPKEYAISWFNYVATLNYKMFVAIK